MHKKCTDECFRAFDKVLLFGVYMEAPNDVFGYASIFDFSALS